MVPGTPTRYDYEYKRCGTANLFLFLEPKAGWRHVEVTEKRRKLEFAEQMRYLAEVRYPDVAKIDVVLDNLSTHSYSALYLAFPPDKALAIAERLVFHFTPVHGSWLNMVEIEGSVVSRQCLADRIPDIDTLRDAVTPWEAKRNSQRQTIDWRFSVIDARSKLDRLYPEISS